MRRHLAIAVAVALLIGGKVYVERSYPVVEGLLMGHAGDFTWAWGAARDVLAGRDPYRDRDPARVYTHEAPLYYPLPAVLVSLPFAPLSPEVASAAIMAVSSGLLTMGLLKHRAWRALLSTPFLVATTVVNPWSALIIGTALLWPRLAAALALLKPNVGLSLFVRQPSLTAVGIAVGVGCASLAVLPTWPREWFESLGAHRHPIPALMLPIGPLLGAFWLGRHDPAARTALVLAFVPQRLIFYDQLALLLVAKTKRQWAFLVGATQVAGLGWFLLNHGGAPGAGVGDPEPTMAPWVMAGCYLPALWVVVWNSLSASRRATGRDGSMICG